MKKEPKRLGLAIVGAGRVGLIRAELAARHPEVGWIGLAEKNPERGEIVREKCGADSADRQAKAARDSSARSSPSDCRVRSIQRRFTHREPIKRHGGSARRAAAQGGDGREAGLAPAAEANSFDAAN